MPVKPVSPSQASYPPDDTAENLASSARLIRFLETNKLHKKDFAEMIGVTLSYVYNLIDPQLSFSTRITTLERIAVVMATDPATFPEYRPIDHPQTPDAGILYLQDQQAKQGLSNLEMLRRFPRNKRINIVDMWRGTLPLPLNWSELLCIALVLNLTPRDVYPFWEARFRQYLCDGGLDPVANMALTQSMIQGAKAYVGITG